MRAIDTNLLVRIVVRGDIKQAATVDVLVGKGAWISHLALAEATWVLSSGFERNAGEVATAVEMLLNHKSLTIQDSDVVSAALDHFKERPAVGFSDCLLLEIARKAGHLPLGTVDRGLAKLPDTQKL